MLPPFHHRMKHAILWRKKYIHFFQVYFNIQRCSSFVSLKRQKDFTCVQGKFHLNFSLWRGFHEVLTKKNALNICLLLLFESMNSLYPFHTYVQSLATRVSVYMYYGLGLACSDESEGHLLAGQHQCWVVRPASVSSWGQQCTGSSSPTC